MKYVCLVRDEPPLRYFVNTLAQAYPPALVVVEQPPVKKLSFSKKLEVLGFQGAMRRFRQKTIGDPNDEVRDQLLGDFWRGFSDELSIMTCANINDEKVTARLKEMSPDLILDHGTSIVKAPILKTAPLALNLHWGISPYYRGTHCTGWALLAGDVNNIGVTLHELSHRLDGGRVAMQTRVPVEAHDTAYRLNLKLTVAGTQGMLEILDLLRAAKNIKLYPQDHSKGKLFLEKHWGSTQATQLKALEEKGLGVLLGAQDAPEPVGLVQLSQVP